MAVELEGLFFEIDSNADKSYKGVDRLTKSLERMRNAIKGGNGLSSYSNAIEKLSNAVSSLNETKLKTIADSLNDISKIANMKISAPVTNGIERIGKSIQNVSDSDIARINSLAEALTKLNAVGDTKIPKLSNPNKANTATLNSTPAVPSVQDMTQTQVASVTQTIGQVNLLRSVVNGLGGVFSKSFGVATSAVKMLSSALSNTAGVALTTSKKAIGALVSGIGSKLASSVKKTTAGLGTFLSSLKRIAFYRLIRTVLASITQAFREGIKNLYEYSRVMGTTFAQSMNSLATSGTYLKNSLGAMASPIINAIAPAIDFVIDKIVTLLNYINMLFARLSGQSSFTAAKKQATQFAGALDNAGGSASKAAKEIRDATTGIDELNIIMENDATGGGGGSGAGGTDYAGMFEELPIDNSVSEFADKLKDAFNKSDWKELGTIIGDKVNEIVDKIDWKGIGQKMGYWINAGIQTAYYFLDTVNFTNIGTRISEMLNNALEGIDFTYIGRLFVKRFTIILDFILGAITELDWGLVTSKLSDIFIGIFSESEKWLSSVNWKDLGSNLYSKLKDAIVSIKYSELASSLFSALGTAIKSAVNLVGGFIGNIGADIKAWFDSEIKGQNWKETASNLLSAIAKGFTNIGKWALDNVISPFITSVTGGTSVTNLLSAGKKIAESILNGIIEFFKNIGQWVKDHIINPIKNAIPKASIADVTIGVVDNIADLWAWVKGAWAKVVGTVAYFTTGVMNGAKTWWTNVNTWWNGVVASVKYFATGVVNNAKTWWSNVNSWWNDVVASVKYFSTGVVNSANIWWSNVKNWWSNVVGSVTYFTTGVKNSASEWWSNTQKWWSNVVGKVKEFQTDIKDNTKELWEKFKGWWGTATKTLGDVKVTLLNNINGLYLNAKMWWGNEAKLLGEGFLKLKNTALDWWNSAKSFWDEYVDKPIGTLKLKIQEKAEDLWAKGKELGTKLKEGAESVVSGIKIGIVTTKEQIETQITNIFGGAKEKITSALELDRGGVPVQIMADWVIEDAKTFINKTYGGFINVGNVIKAQVFDEGSTWRQTIKTILGGITPVNFRAKVAETKGSWWTQIRDTWKGSTYASSTAAKFTVKPLGEPKAWITSINSMANGSSFSSTSIGFHAKPLNEAGSWWSSVVTWARNKFGTVPITMGIKTPTIRWTTRQVNLFGTTFTIPSFYIDWNAVGGILDGAQLFGMNGNHFLGGGEAGREAVLPLETHTEWMDTVAERVWAGLPDNSSGYESTKQALIDFYSEYVSGTVNQIASDTNRQANKSERTVVQISGRTVNESVKQQSIINGYNFG